MRTSLALRIRLSEDSGMPASSLNPIIEACGGVGVCKQNGVVVTVRDGFVRTDPTV